MNEITIFENEQFGKIRTMVNENGETFFVGKDVAEALGYKNIRDAINKHVDPEDKGVAICDTLGGKQELTIINESGLYSLVLLSKLPSAKSFKRWVTSEVLPSIRKTGSYSAPSYHVPQNFTEALKLAYEQQLQIDKMFLENKELSDDLNNANKRIDYQRNEIKSRKEAMKEQHQQILDLETKNMVLDRRNLKLENEALANAGKVNYYDRCQKEADKTLKGIRKTANLLGIKEEIFINTLLYNGYLYRDRYGKLRAYAKYLNKFFMLKECEENEYGFTPTQTCTTINGRKFIIENWSRLYKKYQDYINSIK